MDNVWVVGSFIFVVFLASIDILRRTIKEFLRLHSQKETAKIMRRLRRPVQPWVTVIIFGTQDKEALEATKRSIYRSRYYAYDISVVGPRARTYQTAYRKSRRGKIVICLLAGVEVDRSFIKRTVALRSGQRQWRVPVYENHAISSAEIMGIVNRLKKIIWERPIMVEACTAAALRSKKIPTPHTFQTSQIIPVVTQIIAIAALVLGIMYGDITILWWVWLLITSYLAALVWLEEVSDWRARWRLTFSIPSALFLVPVASIVAGISQVSTRK